MTANSPQTPPQNLAQNPAQTPTQTPDLGDDFAALSRILHSRYSARAFLPDAVPDQVVAEIVRVAGRVPSWCNAQPWQVHVTRPAQTQAFSQMLLAQVGATPPQPDIAWPAAYTGAYQQRRRDCGFQLYDAVGIAREDKAARAAQMLENYRFFGAPHVAVITSEADLGGYGAMDTGGFVAAFTLAAQAAGLACVPQAAIAAYAPAVRAHFNLPDTRLVLCAISFGYADESHPINGFRTARAGLDEVLCWV